MIRTITIRGRGGEQTLTDNAFPLALGGPDAVVDIAASEEALAYIGEDRGHVFVQAVQTQTPVWHRHEQLSGSAWLKSGDTVQIGETLMLWSVQGEQAFLDLSVASEPQGIVAPPSDLPSAPIYEPSLPNTDPGEKRGAGLWLSIAGLFLLLLLGAAYVLFANPYSIRFDPQADSVEMDGLFPHFELGGRAMALSGSYRLQASKQGYEPFDQEIEIKHGGDNRFEFTLTKLPGRVTLETTPEGAALSIADKAMGNAPFSDLKLPAGEHSLQWSAPGYLPLEANIQVMGMDQAQRFSFELEKNSAPVSLDSQPTGAAIYAGDTQIGQTPASLDLDAGNHQLRLVLDGYEPYRLSLDVVAKQPQDLGVIALKKPNGQLKLTTTPPGATVTVDGQYLGTTPLEAGLSPEQEHKLVISRAGYKSASRTLSLKPAEQQALNLKLAAEYGIVFIQASPADAELLVDGKPQGPANTRLKLPTRAHRIEVRKAGFQTHTATVTPRASASQTLKIKLASSTPPKPKATAPVISTKQSQKLIRMAPNTSITLGASRREQGRRANETLRTVTLKRPFYVSDKEVSNNQFHVFKGSHNSGAGDANGGDRPVANVSWDDAARYLNWLSQRDGLPEAFEEKDGKMHLIRPVNTGYRFPTEAEWTYVARFAQREKADKYPWSGENFPPFNPSGNFADSSAKGQLPVVLEQYTDGFPAAAPVGSFRPNAAGFYDLGGNVAEWCLDYYSVALTSSGQAETDPVGGTEGRHHVVRGSSWKDATISELRLSYREYSDKPRDDLGFRIARYAE
ncbi:MAG: PEGA domain-containing protein [Gammaproteobacteria bacterium]